MAAEKRVPSWVVTDDFWSRVEPLIPIRVRPEGKEYARKTGAGRKPKAPLAQEQVGPNPTDREKNGSQRHLLKLSINIIYG